MRLRYALPTLAALALVAGCDVISSADSDPPPVVFDDTPQPLNSDLHDTGVVAFRVFNTGFHGAATGSAPDGFVYGNGATYALYEGQLLVGLGPDQVSGRPYQIQSDGDPSEWSAGSGLLGLEPPSGYDQAFRTRFTDAGAANPNPIGLQVTQWSYSNAGDAFAVVAVDVENTGPDRTGLTVGLFADFDLSDNFANRGGYDAATRTVYTYDPTGADRTYYGISALTGSVSGWTDSAGSVSEITDALLYRALTTPGTAATADGERRSILGVGPFAIASGATQRVVFAYVAGTGLTDLLANAAAARSRVPAAP